jgi:DNA polymerase
MILAVGRVAAQNLLLTDESIGRLRGKFFELNNIPLMATYHPSALLRNVELKRPAWEDLKLFKSKLLELNPNYESTFN